MKKAGPLVLGIAVVGCFTAAAAAIGQTEKRQIEPRVSRAPVITSVSQVGYASGITNIVIEGRNFPESGAYIVMGPDRATPSTPLTSTKMAGTLGSDTEPGKTYKVALYRNTTRISNEVDYFFLYQLHDVEQGSRVKPGDVVDIRNNQRIGSRGAKIVKFGSQTAPIISWDPSLSSIRVRVPDGLPLVSAQAISLEENGKLISNKISITVSSVPFIRK